jgi:hypothetical protein
MFAVSESKKTSRVRSSKSSGSRVTSRSLPPQWNPSRKKTTTLPLFLQILLIFQRTSAGFALAAVGTTLVLYGLTEYTQQLWNRQYQRLNTLQRHERTVTSINEALQNKITEQATTGNQDLTPISPDKNIYLEPAVVTEIMPKQSSQLRPIEFPKTDRPLAY